MKIKLGLSNAFKNKENLLGHDGAHKSYIPTVTDAESFCKHVLSGKAWSMGYFVKMRRHRLKGQQYPVSRMFMRQKPALVLKWKSLYRRRHDYWTSSRLLALDFDQGNVSVEVALTNPLINQYAMMVHPSPSSTPEFPKTRVIFVLSERVTSADAWVALQTALLCEFSEWKPDMACKDTSREFKGSDRPGAYASPKAVLPLRVAAGLIAPIAAKEMELYLTKAHSAVSGGTGGKNFKEIKEEVERIIGADISNTDSKGRCRKAVRCPMANHTHDDHAPAFYWYPEKAFGFCYKCEASNGNGIHNTFAIARRYGIEVDAKRNRNALRVPKAPESKTQSVRQILQRSEKLQEQAVSYLYDNFAINPLVARSHLCGALGCEKSFEPGCTLQFTRYLIPHYWRDEFYGARVHLDKLSVQRSWLELEEQNQKLFDQYHAQFTKVAKYDTPQYWQQVYKLVGGEGFLEERRTYNIGAVIERKGERLYPRRNLGLMIVANNDEFDVLTALSAGYCAIGATESAKLDWLLSETKHKIVVAYKGAETLAQSIAKKAGAYAIAYLPETMSVLKKEERLANICEKYRLFPIGERV